MSRETALDPKTIFEEYARGNNYKASIGDKGIFEQSKINERFYVGDQWYGAKAGNSRPLVRRNIIKRIGEYKISAIGSAPVAVNFSADGVPDTSDLRMGRQEIDRILKSGEDPFISSAASPDALEVSVIMSAMSDYFSASSERLRFSALCEEALRSAYISGTSFLYTYWDDSILTGLYADSEQKAPIKGDVACEVLAVENVNLGDPSRDDIESQPYIIISQRKCLSDVIREAEKYHVRPDLIKADDGSTYHVLGGDRGETEQEGSKKVTVLTKFYKKYDKSGNRSGVYAIRVTENAVIRPEWNLGITMYPIAKLCWERRKSCAYGDSEITYLIPNQIAINRALTAAVWATMNAGMPKLAVNTDAYDGPLNNDPGQVIRLNNMGAQSIDQVVKYLQPPAFAGAFQNLVNDIAGSTLTDSGATDAALGNIKPDNAAAIIQSREASLQPLQILQNHYYDFIECAARIRADFWLCLYGDRSLKVTDRNGTRYIPFHADRYKNLVINAKVDVGASTLWSEAVVISTLDGLLGKGLITFEQYLERLPKGLIPDATGLIDDAKAAAESAAGNDEMMGDFAKRYPREYAEFSKLPADRQQAMLKEIKGSGEDVDI